MKSTNSDLLIRIDERQKEMSKDIADINKKLGCFVAKDDEYKDMSQKVDTLWDDRNKIIGYVLGAGAVGGTLPLLIQSIIKSVWANF